MKDKIVIIIIIMVEILFVKDKIIMVKIEVHAGRHYGQKDLRGNIKKR